MVRKTFKINGMHCTSCAMLIEGELEEIGVKASCNYARATLEVEFDPQKVSKQDIQKAVSSAGYRVDDPVSPGKKA